MSMLSEWIFSVSIFDIIRAKSILLLCFCISKKCGIDSEPEKNMFHKLIKIFDATETKAGQISFVSTYKFLEIKAFSG